MPPITLRAGAEEYRVSAAEDGAVSIEGHGTIAVRHERDGSMRIEGLGRAWTAAAGDTRWVFADGEVYEFQVQQSGRSRRAGSHHDSLAAPMPATVLRIQAPQGANVKRGDTLILLEAMKMELPLRAPADGVVTAVHCREGDLVQPGTPLIELDD